MKRSDLEGWIKAILNQRYPEAIDTYNRFTAADIVTMLVDRQIIPQPEGHWYPTADDSPTQPEPEGHWSTTEGEL